MLSQSSKKLQCLLSDACEMMIEGTHGNFESPVSQSEQLCQYTICVNDSSHYQLLVIDQATLPVGDGFCLTPVTVATDRCSEDKAAISNSCDHIETPYFVIINSSCSCTQFTQPTKGRFATFGKRIET